MICYKESSTILFVVNPIAGTGKRRVSEEAIYSCFPQSEYSVEIRYTEKKGHAAEIVKAAIGEGHTATVVACGGDGTVNEIASVLIGSDIALGVVPTGSGNGLAKHLGVPKNVDRALQIIKERVSTKIDVGYIAGRPFFSNVGLGVDAAIIRHYSKKRRRGLFAYIMSSLSCGIRFKGYDIKVEIPDGIIKTNPFFLFISNSMEMGYGMSLTPNAKITDGLLDLIIIDNISILKRFYFSILVLMNKADLFKRAYRSKIKHITIFVKEKGSIALQIDGEAVAVNEKSLEISVMPAALYMITGIENKNI